MIRAGVMVAVFAGLILLLAAKAPAWLAITGSVMALALVCTGGLVRGIHRAMLVQWGKIPEAQVCQRCSGWGVLNKHKEPYDHDTRTMAHVLWAAGNRRDCPDCNGRGSYSPRRAANKTPGPVTILQPAEDPDDLLYPDGPDEPQIIEPTSVLPPEWWKRGEKT